MLRGKLILLMATSLALSPGGAARADTEAVLADEQILRAAGVGVNGPALVDFFRKRTPSQVDRGRLEQLIQQLGDERFERRQKASVELTVMGSLAVPLLRQALKSNDPEVVRRAERILKTLDAGPNLSLLAAASRLLAVRKPPGAAAALLAYLPFADASARDDLRAALTALAVVDGKPEPALVKALHDARPLKRGAAGEALCRAAAAGVEADVRTLLKDSDPGVRLRVALAFFARRHRDAVPVLIDLVGELPQEQIWRVEEVLYQLAGDKAPDLSTATGVTPARMRQAWADWWRDHGAQVDLAKLDQVQPSLGFTVLVEKDARSGNTGRVVELGRDGKPRWQVEGLLYPLDVQVLSTGRILVAENNGNRVTERDLKGTILWQKQVTLPVSCERLRNGNTFIATSTQIIEVDRSGKELFTFRLPNVTPQTKIIAARKLPNGHILYVTCPGTLTRLDAAGKILKSFPVGKVSFFSSTIHLLPNGRVLIPEYIDNKVVEYDAAGKAVWTATVKNPVSVFRLSNGNTLVASPSTRKLVEVNRAGKEVSESTQTGMPRQARRR
jgi:hypothetical protein